MRQRRFRCHPEESLGIESPFFLETMDSNTGYSHSIVAGGLELMS